MSDQADIVERLGDLARFYLNEKPDDPISQEEREEIASELSSAAAEIKRLRAALAERTEECARVADEFGKQARRRVEKADTHWSLYTASGGISAAHSIADMIRKLEL